MFELIFFPIIVEVQLVRVGLQEVIAKSHMGLFFKKIWERY